MKSIKSILLTLAVLFTAGVFTAEAAKITTIGTKPKVGNGNSGSPYEIRTADELRWFVHYENTRHWFPDDHAKLMDNIDLSEVCGPEIGSWIPLGYSEEEGASGYWKGHLDGNGCKITGLYIDGDDFDVDDFDGKYVKLGLIGHAESHFEVKNLRIEGEIKNVNYNFYAGGLIGFIDEGNGKLNNCVSHVTITERKEEKKFRNEKDYYIGGLVGYIGKKGHPLIQNCAYSGHLEGEEKITDFFAEVLLVGGLIGGGKDKLEHFEIEDYTRVENCTSYTGGEYPLVGTGHPGMDIRNCITDNAVMYYLDEIDQFAYKTEAYLSNNYFVPSDFEDPVCKTHLWADCWRFRTLRPHLDSNQEVTIEEIASGKACYDMNQKLGGNFFTQKIGTDGAPYPNGLHGTVYKVKEYTSCSESEVAYSNEPFDITDHRTHTFADGSTTCSNCSAPNPSDHSKTADGFYILADSADVQWLRQMVNDHGITNLKVRLTADIDMNGATIVPLKEYSGEMDGAGHTISNFILRTYESSRDGGLVGCLQGGGKIHDLTLAGIIFAQPNTNLGAFAGRVKEGCELRGLRNDCMLFVQGNVYSGQSELNIGGIVGVLEGQMSCCINNGQIIDTSQKYNYSATTRMGGVVGFAKSKAQMTKLVNNAFVGSNSFSAVWGDAIAYCEVPTNAPTESYYVNGFERQGCNYFFSNSSTCATAVTKDQLGSGEVCYLLNGSQSPAQTSDLSFGQKIGTDVAPYPYVTAAHPGVHPAKFYYNCTDYSNYSNSSTDATPRGHDFSGGKHYCDVCYTIDETIAKVDGVYQIKSADDFNLFAQAVNGANEKGKSMRFASAALTTSIQLDGDNFTTINTLHGTLDGRGNTITIPVSNNTHEPRNLVETLASTGKITYLNLKGQYSGETHIFTNPVCLLQDNYSTVSNCMFFNAQTQSGEKGNTFIDCYTEYSIEPKLGVCAGKMTRFVVKQSDGYHLYDGYSLPDGTWGNWKTFTKAEAKNGTMAYYLSHKDPSQPCVWGQNLSASDGDNEPRIYWNQTPRSASFVSNFTYYDIENRTGKPTLYNANTPLNPGDGFMVYSDGESSLYLDDPNNIVANADGTYSAKRINLDPTAQTYLPIEVEAEQFTFCKTVNNELVPVTCNEGELVSLLFPVDMPISNINGTVYMFEGFRDESTNTKLLIFNSDLDCDEIPANTPMIVKAKGGQILKDTLKAKTEDGIIVEKVHVYPMTGNHSISTDYIAGTDTMTVTHYVSYNNEQTMKMEDTPDQKTVFYTLGYDETEVYYPRTFDNPVTVSPMNSFFTIANATDELQYKNLTLSFSDPASKLTAVAGVLNSICPEHDGYLTAPEGQTLDIYVFAGIHDGYVYGIPAKDKEAYGLADGYICAGVPYIFTTNGTSVTFNRTFTDYDYERYSWYGEYNPTYRASQKNGLQGVLKGDGAQLHGHDYIVFTKNGLKYAPAGEDSEGNPKTVTVGRGKCFIIADQPAPAQAQARRIAAFNDDADGIEEIVNSKSSNSKCYNLQGLRVGKDYKGIVIENGQKVLKK